MPIMILHAEDDLVVPFKLGKALFESAQDGRAVHWPKVTEHLSILYFYFDGTIYLAFVQCHS